MSKQNGKSTDGGGGVKSLAANRKARFDYEILDKLVAGIVLRGGEVKSIRLGEFNLEESYVRPERGELYWIGAYIKPYLMAGREELEPTRKRKLLLSKREIDKLVGQVSTAGLTIVPLALLLKGGRVKLEIGLARGKKNRDKREAIKERQAKREISRLVKRR
ncbi:MAG TPA: SsrA-binding protein SmpB [Oligoflexia bacterium]|nr:SsrA-binding protein SmpB [Oligoflexia bacterium]HMP27362.1 SsrA-binding protein SmpB [Oligoflexia bacterium]